MPKAATELRGQGRSEVHSAATNTAGPSEAKSADVSGILREEDKVLRLRLEKARGSKKIGRLASAQDDGAFCAAPTATVAAAKRRKRKVRREKAAVSAGYSENPLFDLPEEDRAKLFAWLRECPYDDAVRHILKDQGLAEVSSLQLDEFFQLEAESHWEKRIERAAHEANALIRLVETNPVKFSSGILAALGQEAFRQIASGQVQPEAMGRMATLFLKARSDERADQMQELKREKLRQELQGQIEQALERLAEEVDKNPGAREAFEALRREIFREGENREGEL